MDKQTVAGAVGYSIEEEIGVYLVGMDDRYAQHRPGWLMNWLMIRTAYETKKKRINFLRGDEPYKERLGSVATGQQRWQATSNRFLPQLRYAALKRGIQVRDWLQKKPASVSTSDDVD